jgi:hypothetical protein
MHIPESTHTLDLQRIEFGEYLIAALLENGLDWRHDALPDATIRTMDLRLLPMKSGTHKSEGFQSFATQTGPARHN